MTPEILNLTLFRGIHFGPQVVTCNDANGNAVNITNWLPYAEGRIQPEGTLAVNFAPSVSNGTLGQVTIEHTNANTTNFPLGRGGWDLVMQAPNGQRFGPYAAGRFAVSDLHSQPV